MDGNVGSLKMVKALVLMGGMMNYAELILMGGMMNYAELILMGGMMNYTELWSTVDPRFSGPRLSSMGNYCILSVQSCRIC